MSNKHYARLVRQKRKTRLASCGYLDRFDPFTLNDNPYLRELYRGLFSSFLGESPCERLLDIGCGTGIYFDALALHARRIDAIDLSPEMIRVAQDYCQNKGLKNISAITGSAEHIGSEDGAYDVAVGFDILHHLENPDKSLAEICRVLKPGGKFLVFEPNIRNPLIYLMHALAPEERLALGRNHPEKMIGLLEKHFKTLHWEGVCAIITQAKGPGRIIISAFLWSCKFLGLSGYYPRQVWLGTKI